MQSSKRFALASHGGLAAVLACALLAGCAATHGTVDVERERLTARAALDCRVQLGELVDSVGPRVHVGSAGDTWEISGMTDSIRQQVADWQPEAAHGGTDISLNLELVRAYSEPKTTQIYFHTVLLAGVEQSERQVFRGSYDVMSWFGNREEFMLAMQSSLDDALGKLHNWLSDRCARA